MTIRFETDLERVDWNELARVFELAPLGTRDADTLRIQFLNSQVRCFAYDGAHIVGAGRALSDRVSWTIIFDLILLPAYQGRGTGRAILQSLLSQGGARNAMLHAVPGKQGFYMNEGFRPMKTALALFSNAEWARESGYVE